MPKNPTYLPLSPGVTALKLGGVVRYLPRWLPKAVADDLMHEVRETSCFVRESIQMGGLVRVQPRGTSWYGRQYTVASRYLIAREAPKPGPRLSEVLKNLPYLNDWTPNAVLVNEYRNGQDSVGWHADDERSLGVDPTIVSLSLGATRRFMFRPKDTSASGERFDVQLAHGDLLIMSGSVQTHYNHQVPKLAVGALSEARVNLTARHYPD
jgi:alkylated DNA repair dioxygenase AlkB